MAIKFAEFLQIKKIDPRRLVASSRQIERLRPEDRQLRLARRKKSGDSDEGENTPKEKPRSGRTVTPRLIENASLGKAVSGPAKTRLLRAVNRVLEQRKEEAVDLRALF